MRKLIVCNIVTIDGYFEGPGKDIMALFAYRGGLYPEDESFDLYNAERLRAAGTLLLGRTTFEMFRAYWPSVADDPNATPVSREISRLNNAIEKVVISDGLKVDAAAPWGDTRVVSRAAARAAVAELKAKAGKDILVFGSRTLWNELLAQNLVDEIHLIVAPVVLGAGVPAFAAPPQAPLRLVESRSWEGVGTALLRYAFGAA